MNTDGAGSRAGGNSRIVTPLEIAILLFLAAIFGCMTFYIVSRLGIGVDVSDGAYYIISYALHHDIEAQSTVAGWVWAAISPFDGILANRYFGVIFLFLCFSALSLSLGLPRRDNRTGALIGALFSLAGSLPYYSKWLPDPSYNLVNLGFMSLAWAGLFQLQYASRWSGVQVTFTECAWAVLVGVSVATVFLAKATSAALLGPLLLGCYLWSAWGRMTFSRICLLGLAAFAGLMVPFLALATIGETPVRVFNTMNYGYRAATTIASLPLNLLESLSGYASFVRVLPLFNTWYTAAILVVVAVALWSPATARARIPLWFGIGLSVAAAVSIPVLLWFKNAFAQTDHTINAVILMTFCFTIAAASLSSNGSRLPIFLCASAMFVSLFIFTFGTGSSWPAVISTAAGFAFTALGAAISRLAGPQRVILAIPSIALLACALFVSARSLEQHPYRLAGPLGLMTWRATVGPYDETFRESETQAEFYNTLAKVRPLVKALPDRPYLIDLSGRVPMVAYQIGARAPRTPWILSGYPGSEPLFRMTIGEIPPTALAAAWIFQAHDYAARFPDSILDQFGLRFPQDYIEVATVPVQYLDTSGRLYAPRSSMQGTRVPDDGKPRAKDAMTRKLQ